jgi:hypothetical protein
MSRLTDFYRGHGIDSRGRTLDDLWNLSDDSLESIHDFIQWMFPLREPSQFNRQAPLLTDADVAAFHAEPGLRENLQRSFEVFLAFLGLNLVNGRVVEAADFDRKRGVFEEPNHNWLRISRVLASTRTLGLVGPSRALFAFLKGLHESSLDTIPAETFGYWQDAAGFDDLP